MDPFSIAAIVSMIAGAGLQAYSANQAAKKQQQAAIQAQQRQLQERQMATDVAAKRTAEFDPSTRQQNQQQIQQDMTGQLQQQVQPQQITAQGVQVGSTIPDQAAGSDYMTAKAKEAAKTAASLHGLAGLMGRIGSASELRRNEAVGIGDTAGEIGRIQNGADNIAGIDQIGIDAAGRPNLGLQLAGAALGAYGSSQLAGAGLGTKTPQLDASLAYPSVGSPKLGSGLFIPKVNGGALGSGTWVGPAGY